MKYSSTYRVTYSDTDQMGIVYHANYVIFFDRSRTEMLRAAGWPYAEMEKQGIIMPVASVNCNYRKPAHYDDLLTFTSWIREIRGARVVIGNTVTRDGELLADGDVVLAYTQNGKVARPSAAFLELCEKLKP